MTLVLSAFFTALVTKSRSVKRKQYTSIWRGGQQGEQARPGIRARVLGPQPVCCDTLSWAGPCTSSSLLHFGDVAGGTQILSNTFPAPCLP